MPTPAASLKCSIWDVTFQRGDGVFEAVRVVADRDPLRASFAPAPRVRDPLQALKAESPRWALLSCAVFSSKLVLICSLH